MFHLLQDFLVATESPDLHGFEVGPLQPLLPTLLATSALAALTNMLVRHGKEETGVKEWICQLPASTREQLMRELEETKANMSSTGSYLQLLERAWRLLFSPDWRRVTLREQLGRQVPKNSPKSPPSTLYSRQGWTLRILWKRRASSCSSWQVLEPEDVVDLHSTEAQPALG